MVILFEFMVSFLSQKLIHFLLLTHFWYFSNISNDFIVGIRTGFYYVVFSTYIRVSIYSLLKFVNDYVSENLN